MSRSRAHNPALGSPRGRAICALLAWVAAICCSGSLAAAKDAVVVVLGSTAEPYRLAGDACVQSLREGGIEASVAPLEGFRPASGTVYVVVGGRALETLAGAVPAGTPLVYCMVSRSEVAEFSARAGTTGVTTSIRPADQFELMGEILPRARRIGVLHRSGSESSATIIAEAREQLPSGWELELVDLDGRGSIADAISRVMSSEVDAVWTIPDPTVYDATVVKALLLAALRAGKPVFGFSSQLVKAGTLAGVGIDPGAQGRQAAGLVLRVLGEPGRTPPPVSPEFVVAVNLMVAEKIGVKIPQDVLNDAAERFR